MTNLFRGPITGAKFFAIIASFFVVIIAVNLVLAVSAVRSFSGLEVKNSYVASQSFDKERAAQLALGWTVSVVEEQGQLRLSITDKTGAPVVVDSVTGVFGWAASTRGDVTPEFVFNGVDYVAPVVASPGNWNLRFEAIAKDGTVFRQRVVVRVAG